jgi:hypothetical protein
MIWGQRLVDCLMLAGPIDPRVLPPNLATRITLSWREVRSHFHSIEREESRICLK